MKDCSSPNLWQSSIWNDFQKSIGRKTWQVCIDDASALVIKHDISFGLNWLEVPRGPLFYDENSLNKIIEKIEEIARKEKSIFVRFSPYYKINQESKRIKFAKKDHHPETSLVIDLSLTEDEILDQMKPKGRYNIKTAIRHDVDVFKSDDIESFYAILSKTSNRDGFSIHKKSYYENMLKVLGDNACLFLAKYQDRIISGGIFVYVSEWGIYYYGASDNNYRNVMAPYLIQWEAIKEAKNRGCKYFDFLGISPEGSVNHSWFGVTSFKKKFGGEIVNYPKAKDYIISPFWYFVYKLYK